MVLFLLLAALLLPVPRPSFAGPLVRLVSVHDADTIRVEIDGEKHTVRLIGVDAPEVDGPYRTAELGGDAATAFARRLLGHGPVRLEADPGGDDVDKYDRLLRYVHLADGRDAGAEIIAAGYAQAYRRFRHSRRDAYLALEKAAKEAKRGLWGDCGAGP